MTSPSPPRRSGAKCLWLILVAGGLWLPECLLGRYSLAEDNPPEITVPELQSHAAFLSSDTLQGREAGTQGGQATVAYISAELKRLGCTPLGSETDYRQPFGRGFQNVLGLLPGSDPELQKEWIVLGAHCDHVGFGRPDNSRGPIGLIHNGADDNASGVSCLLEIAEHLAVKDRPRRSVMIAFWDAEEKGLLGSWHWISTLKDRQKVRFYFNLDMVGRMQDDKVEAFGIRTLPGLRTHLARSNAHQLKVHYDWSQRDDSDHYSFYRYNIPYLMIFSGMHDDYHRPSDDPEKLNVEGIRKIGETLSALTLRVADDPQPLTFRDASRYELTRTVPAAPMPSRLGVTWSPSRKLGETIRLTKVEEDSPAQQAGLKVGDELVKINGTPVTEIDDFIAWIRSSRKHLVVDLIRGETQATEQVTFDLAGMTLPPGLTAASDSAEPGIGVINFIAPGGEAEKAGFLNGDRIHSVDESQPDLSWEVERDGQLLKLPR